MHATLGRSGLETVDTLIMRLRERIREIDQLKERVLRQARSPSTLVMGWKVQF